jgi:hypothetical protein
MWMFPPHFFSGEQSRERLYLALLIFIFVVISCLSLVFVMQFYGVFHLVYDRSGLLGATLVVAAFIPVLLLFAFAEFSFGYFVGFYFSFMIVGYLWINVFSELSYDHRLAGISASASIVAFLLPALFISSPIRQKVTMSPQAFDRLLSLLFLLCLATVVVAANYNFRFELPSDVSNLRRDSFPTYLNYLIGITSSSLLPFLFACFVARKDRWRAGGVLVLLLFYYPIAMTKTAFFAPAWLVFMVLLSRIFKARYAVILSLLLPMLFGVALVLLLRNSDAAMSHVALPFFFTVNLRITAIPSIAMDVYNDFFSKHEITYFCQIRMLKSIINCPYQDQLSIVMLNSYPAGGNFNASLFATEGIASVGTLFAPVSVFVAGLVVALGNRLSAGLPPSFIFVSGAILPLIFLNVPLSIVLLTHGAGFLFLLWYITPRGIFKQE